MTPAVRAILGASLVPLLAAALAAQQTTRDGGVAPVRIGTSALTGIILDDVTNQPIRRAVVTISDSDAGVRLAFITDDTGAFSFSSLPDGRYLLSAGKAGYVPMSYGAKKSQRPGTPIALATGQRRADLAIRLPPGAVLSGTVRNRAGQPVPDARVQILRQTVGYDTGERTLAPAGRFFLGQTTDNRGMYRAYGLPADDYLVLVTIGIGIGSGDSALARETTAAEVDWATRSLKSPAALMPAPPPGQAVEYAPVFHPGVSTAAAAALVSVKAGEERDGVDILLDRTPMARITGTIVSPTGNLPDALQVNVVAHENIPGVPFSGFGNARVDPGGHFVTSGLPPGDYTLTVRASGGRGGRGASPAPASPLFGIAVVNVNGVDVDKTITLDTGVEVEGHLIFEGTTLTPPADLTKVRVLLTAARSKLPTLGVPETYPDATGTFTFRGVTPGRYRLSAFAPGGWAIRGATLDGRDTLDEPVEIGRSDVRSAEIRFTDVQTEINGDLLDTTGQPAPEYFIVLFPVDKSFWVPQSRRIQSARPTSAGKFRFQNLPAGEYFITAVTDVEQGQWFDPGFLSELVGASVKITLADGEKKTQSLRIR